MKIISHFHDYYDSIIGYGIDPLIQYKRFKTSFPFSNRRLIYKNDNYNGVMFETFVVLFCGSHYVGFRVTKTNRFNEPIVDIFYDKKGFLKFLKGTKFEPRPYWHFYRRPRMKKIDKAKYFDLLVAEIQKEFIKLSYNNDWHVKYKTPIMVLDFDEDEKKYSIICSPKLKDYKFQKVKDPFTAFQEISMFISNLFGYPGNPIIEISDKDKIKKHGFDKWSFRKMKGD